MRNGTWKLGIGTLNNDRMEDDRAWYWNTQKGIMRNGKSSQLLLHKGSITCIMGGIDRTRCNWFTHTPLTPTLTGKSKGKLKGFLWGTQDHAGNGGGGT